MKYTAIKTFFNSLNIYTEESKLRKAFEVASKGGVAVDLEAFLQLYRKVTRRKELVQLFMNYCDLRRNITVDSLVLFLQKEQMEVTAGEKFAKLLTSRFARNMAERKDARLSYDGFLAYLLSPDGDIFNKKHHSVYQDMNQPLSNYFINSSHNTYLVQDQLVGASSIQGYLSSLRDGCRCVEIDCWDGPQNEPIVYHGKTLTSRITFRNVIRAINQEAFVISKFPVVLSLENHCSFEQQKTMARHLKNILGKRLLTTTLDGDVPHQLPSPSDLRERFLIKGKRVGSIKDDIRKYKSSMKGGTRVEKEEKQSQGASHKTVPEELSNLVVYMKSIHFNDLASAQAEQKCYMMSSLNESKAKKVSTAGGANFVSYTRSNIVRIYPLQTRIDSSNYNPVDLWNYGCQMVALNFQTAGIPMDLNRGFFRNNGRCGYVLKPSFMTDGHCKFSPDQPTFSARKGVELGIKIISAQNIQFSRGDIVVRAEVHGVPDDNYTSETIPMENKCYNPTWNEVLYFTIRVPELAILRLAVEGRAFIIGRTLLGQVTLPFTSVKSGFRHAHLLDKDGSPILGSTLFLYIWYHSRMDLEQ
uniref:1-phosphatidylinositol 4,5-bisphosphate phosphodiesterase delta-4-like isoform X2 n=1 Tax=Myxine glutinosa TaxID=7769 RepID=UPI00358FEC95